MQHWLKTISSSSDPFCDSFEGLLQSRSRQKAEDSAKGASQTAAAGSGLDESGEAWGSFESSDDDEEEDDPSSSSQSHAVLEDSQQARIMPA